MSGAPKIFCIFFVLLTLASIGHDVWYSQQNHSEFAFSQIGGLITHYAKTEHDEARTMIADEIGAEGFNATVGTLLSFYTAAFTGFFAVLFGVWGFVKARRQAAGAKNSKSMNFRR